MPRKPTPRKRTLQELYKAVWDKAIKDGWLKLKFANSQEMHRARFVLYNVIKAEDKAGNHLFAAAARGHSIRYDPESPKTTLIISSRVKDSINDVFEQALEGDDDAPAELVQGEPTSPEEASTRARAPAQAHTPTRVSQQQGMTAADQEEFEQAERSQALLLELLGGGGKAPRPELEAKKAQKPEQEPGKPRVTPYYTRG